MGERMASFLLVLPWCMTEHLFEPFWFRKQAAARFHASTQNGTWARRTGALD